MLRYQLTSNGLWKYVNEIFGDVELAYLPPHGNSIRSMYAKEYERTLRLAADRHGQGRQESFEGAV
jgi:fatty-acyl-CoA synthase